MTKTNKDMQKKFIFIIAILILSIQAINADEIVVGENVSISEDFTKDNSSSTISIQNDSNSDISNGAPYFNYYKYSTLQTLYTPSEIGKSGDITSISFKVANAAPFATSEVKVYLGHKSSKFSGKSDFVKNSNLTLVYSGNPTLGSSTGWEKLTFNKGSFTYNGTDNLVVVITKKCNNYNSSLKYYYFTGDGYTLYRRSDSTESFGDVSNTSNEYSTTTSRPSIRITIENKSNQLPYCNYYKYSTFQTLYTPSEIGKSGKIKSISFKVADASSFATSEVKVYLGHKSSKFSGKSDFVKNSNLTLVYSGNPTLGSSTGWEKLTLNQGSFTYNGTDNLVVVITKKCNNYNSSLKYCYFTGEGYTLYRRSDKTESFGDVTNISNEYDTTTSRPSIRISVDGPAKGNSVPYENYYKYSTLQTLYAPTEIGKSGKISSISFKVADVASFVTSEVKVYLGHKSSKFSGKSDFVKNSNLTLVYSGNPTLGSSAGWEKLTFNQGSFTYNGTDNLVVVITKKCNNYNNSLKYYYFTGDGYTLYRRSDSTESFGDVTNTSDEYSTTSSRPSIKVNIGQIPISADKDYTIDGVTYTLHTNATATIKALTSNYRKVVIPNTVSYSGFLFEVNEIGASAFSAYISYSIKLPETIKNVNSNAFNNSKALSVLWNGIVNLTSKHINNMKKLSPNVLIYVNSLSNLAASGIQDTTNLIVNNSARKIELKDGADFHCPKQFYAQSIIYKRDFTMISGINGQSAGWETIALPFNVETIQHRLKGELIPFYSYNSTSNKKPFWLYSWGSSGWIKASSIKYNTPYLISVPNNEYYMEDFILGGEIAFSSTYTNVYESAVNSTDYNSSSYNGTQFYPSFVLLPQNNYIYNVNSGSTPSETDNKTPGSVFIKNLRNVKPFEGYLYSTTSSVPLFDISLFDEDETTGIKTHSLHEKTEYQNGIRVYDLKGKLVLVGHNLEQLKSQLSAGIYIIDGKKIVIGK